MFLPYLAAHFGWNLEQRLWFASINALTQHPMTSLAIFNQQPHPFTSFIQVDEFQKWFDANWHNLPFDTDRRYQKKECPQALKVLSWRAAPRSDNGYGSLKEFYTGDFKTLWNRVRNELHSLGRLGAWSGLEFIKIAAAGELDFEFDTLMLEDMSGSKSHRNGLCLVMGWDDLDWHKSNPNFNGKYSPGVLHSITAYGEGLLREAQERIDPSLGYETLESTLCCYKSWHRPNRRYPSVYNDMAYARLLDTAEKNPTLDLAPFWAARQKFLPKDLRIEDRPEHPQFGSKTLDKGLQNCYRETGEIPYFWLFPMLIENNPTTLRKGEE